ncbi:hypothetical protein N7931_11125 [Catenovulum sp. 2E275]|uniref:hypothetical protein n=1 Tax=Catenovulum sp. 2E275 TaxID=2980497 RepID=UPI0021CEBE27|nr:hypothetical protein [Catenovulum sp. 2E275]MCU4676182.1 hypothetical protein [Catenovulum sp. 2E275]
MPQLKDGSDFKINRHIVGDESGLRNLISACEKAIEQGEYIGSDLDDFNGVTKLETEFLKNNQESKLTPIFLTAFSIVVVFLIFLVVLGFKSFLNWF